MKHAVALAASLALGALAAPVVARVAAENAGEPFEGLSALDVVKLAADDGAARAGLAAGAVLAVVTFAMLQGVKP